MGKNNKTEREKEVVDLAQACKGTFARLAPGRGRFPFGLDKWPERFFKRKLERRKTMETRKWLGILALAVAVLMAPQLSMAEGADTNFGTTVTNTVNLTYGSGANAYTADATVDFVVDRVLDWVMAPIDSTLDVYENSLDNVLAFTVENNTNGPVDILIALAQQNQAPAAIGLYLDVNDNGTYEDGTDTALPMDGANYYLDEMAEDEVRQVLVVVDVVDDAPSTDVYDYIVTTTAHEAGGAGALGAALADDSGDADDTAVVQNVYNDGAGYSDGAADLQYNAYVAFRVVAANLTVTKTAVVTTDPVNGAANPKAIPGATVHYTITVENAGTAAATNVDLSDAIPDNTTYVGSSLSVTGGGTPVLDDTGDPLRVEDAVILGGETMTVEFDVTID